MSRKDDIKKLILKLQRRLQKLKEQQALQGVNTPPEVLIEIEDIETKIENLQTEQQREKNEADIKNSATPIVTLERETEPKADIFPFFINVFALIALWFVLLINNQFTTIFSELFFWPPSRLETFSVSLLLLAIIHLTWRFYGQQLVELVEKADISIISRVGAFLLEIVKLLHPQSINNRILWALFWIALIINLVVVWRLPPVCPQTTGGKIAPDIALYSVTFIVNGVEQIVDNANNSLRVPEADQITVTVKDVTVCTFPFEGRGGTFYVEFRPYNAEGPLWDLVKGSPLSDAASRLTSIPGPASTWVIDNNWQEISILSVHYPPGGTQDPNCETKTCEYDDRLMVTLAMVGSTVSPTPTSIQTQETPTFKSETPMSTLTAILTPLSRGGGQIAFVGIRDDDYEIFVMNADGSGLTRLTHSAAEDSFPTWSPDGSQLGFRSNRDGNFEIYVMSADGSGQTRLTHNAKVNGGLAWSPDGTQIAFVSNRDGNFDIYVMNLNDSGLTRLTHNAAKDSFPTWSPDGSHLAFESERDGRGKIYVINVKDSNYEPARLTNDEDDGVCPDWADVSPAWSPDGTRIAFQRLLNCASWEIYVMNADGSDQTHLSKADAGWNHDSPTWSPDGSKIAFHSNRDYPDSREIYVMNADGSSPMRLTDSQEWDYFNPVWRPSAWGHSD